MTVAVSTTRAQFIVRKFEESVRAAPFLRIEPPYDEPPYVRRRKMQIIRVNVPFSAEDILCSANTYFIQSLSMATAAMTYSAHSARPEELMVFPNLLTNDDAARRKLPASSYLRPLLPSNYDVLLCVCRNRRLHRFRSVSHRSKCLETRARRPCQ